MSKLTFFRQARNDGGVRTGVDVDDALVLHRFDPGTSEDDPGIVWFVDVRFERQEFPHEAEGARAFLLARREEVESALRRLAEELETTGIDSGAWPLRRPQPADDSTSITLVCSAIRRLDGRAIAGKLNELADSWTDIVDALDAEAEWAR